MNLNREALKKTGIFLAFVLGFWIFSMIYLSPAIGGDQVIVQGDMQQVKLMRTEAEIYKEKDGHFPNWTNTLFSGMPTNLITGAPSGNLLYYANPFTLFGLVGGPFNFLFVAMLSMFVLLRVFKTNQWLAAGGAIGYAFATFAITSYEAGHVTKVLAMGVTPAVIGGLVLLSRKDWFNGFVLTALAFGVQTTFNHYQITYYTAIMVLIFGLGYAIDAFLRKETKNVLLFAACSALALGLGLGANILKIKDTTEYAKATMRGGSETASEVPKDGPKAQFGKKGLNVDYAFGWSYGWDEMFTTIIPGYMGGSSREIVGENSAFVDKISENGDPSQAIEYAQQGLPLYWGELAFTSGPIYIGAIFFFLFVLACFVVSGWMRWVAIITTLLSMVLASGRHSMEFNELLFNTLPYYNKFRTPMMALTIANVIIPAFGLFGLQKILEIGDLNKVLKPFKQSLYTTGGFLVLGAIVGYSSDFSGVVDKQLASSGILPAIKAQRESLLTGDLFRTVLLIGLVVGTLWMTLRKKLDQKWFVIIAAVLISFDLVTVARRYLNKDNFTPKEEEAEITPTSADAKVLAAKNNHARVFDLRQDPFNSNNTGKFHHNVGGYHPAKLSRYQDIISFCLTPNGGQLNLPFLMNNQAMDMLNARYLIASTNGSRDTVFERPTALGNAWFVKEIKTTTDAVATVKAINTTAVKDVALFQQGDAMPAAKTFSADSNAKIQLTYYHPDTLKYNSDNSGNGLAIFSEVYYKEKNGEWKAFIDGKEVPVLRANHILRALEIPSGKHQITMVYEANSYSALKTTEAAASGIIMILAVAAWGMTLMNKKES